MAYKVIISNDTHHDIEEIVRYISLELSHPAAAGRFLDAVNKSYSTLADNPYLYALCSDKQLQQEGYRKVVINHYLLLYLIDEAAQTIHITRVVYGGRNYAALI